MNTSTINYHKVLKILNLVTTTIQNPTVNVTCSAKKCGLIKEQETIDIQQELYRIIYDHILSVPYHICKHSFFKKKYQQKKESILQEITKRQQTALLKIDNKINKSEKEIQNLKEALEYLNKLEQLIRTDKPSES